MVPTIINHLIHQYSDHEQPHHDHRQVKSTERHMITCSCNGFSVLRFHDDEMKEEAADGAMQGSNLVVRVLHALRSCVMHAILFPKGVLTQTLYSRMWKDHDHKPQLQASQEILDKSIYELDGILDNPPPDAQVFDLDTEASAKRMASVCAIASKLCYEKEEVIKEVVNRMWKMRFVQFFDCWNEYVKSNSTQAFMFKDKEENANAVVIVFRGTEQNVADWGTDLDFFYYPIQGMGRVHVGFLEALGLATRLDKQTLIQAQQNIIRKMSSSSTPDKTAPASDSYMRTSGLPQAVTEDDQKVIAYDAICSQLRTILRANPEAKVFVTGHSLGGALAALFTAFLMHENDGIQSKLEGVFTFGQPRVGDASFAQYMEERLCAQNKARKYFRVVFRNDVVPRVPPDDVLFQFKHISPCVYYKSFHHCEVMEEEPDKNLLSDILQAMPHIAAISELLIHIRHHEMAMDSHRSYDDSRYGSFHGQLLQLQDEEEDEEELRARVMDVLTPAVSDHSCLRYMEAVKKAPSAFLKQAT